MNPISEERLLAEAIEDEEARLDGRDREDRTKEMSETTGEWT